MCGESSFFSNTLARSCHTLATVAKHDLCLRFLYKSNSKCFAGYYTVCIHPFMIDTIWEHNTGCPFPQHTITSVETSLRDFWSDAHLYGLFTTGSYSDVWISSCGHQCWSPSPCINIHLSVSAGQDDPYQGQLADLYSVMCLNRRFDFASCLICLFRRQHIHYFQVVLSNQDM